MHSTSLDNIDKRTTRMEMETVHSSIYDWPKYYEFVYGSDWRAECDFLRFCFDEYVDGEAIRLFEPACGTGRLIYRLGKLGFQVSGLDLNPKAVEFCNKRFAKHGLPASAWAGDMCDFQVKRPVDAAFNTINSFRHLTSDDMARRHLQCMAKAIRVGGIYALGFHVTPTQTEPEDSEAWSQRRGHLQINTSMWLTSRNLDRRSETHAIAFDVFTPTKQFRILDELAFRTYTLSQFRTLLKAVPEFRIAATYDFAYDLPIELDGETQDVVFILKRC